MREYFKAQLLAVVQGKQESAFAYLEESQFQLMFEVGREMGFKTITQASDGDRRILLNQHNSFSDIYVTVYVDEVVNDFYKVRVLKDSDPLRTIELIQSWWDPLDYVD